MLTQKRLKELFFYSPATGNFMRIRRVSNSGKPGDIVGTVHPRGYVCFNVDGKRYQAHRLAWLYVYGEWPEHPLKHINDNLAFNGIENLRYRT